ncbi:MAG TPA: ribose-5-phosphate isomerase RpiA [Polyangiaceae bacterium]|jgi:ribose 5-phosphate isomerase A|nr:ribose-5-phosphate isomerase RpiA [Polyangiaceae bacterium]
MSEEAAKKRAAEAALELLPEAGVIGLGTGSTTRFFIEAVGELVRQGRRFSGVPTSQQSRALASQCGIPLLDDAGPWQIDLCVDGADEVSEALDLIKGGGGAHTREKVVNFAARKNAIIVDESKLSRRLGERRAVPIEVLVFAHHTTALALKRFGEPTLRLRDGAPVRTDSGNYIYDLQVAPIDEPAPLDHAFREVPGVVETGLFCGRADWVIVAGAARIQQLSRRS